MNCQICAKKVEQIFIVKGGRVILNLCRDCKPLKPIEHYNILIGRLDAMIAETRLLNNEAYRAGDKDAMEQFKEAIEDCEKTKRGLFKPKE